MIGELYIRYIATREIYGPISMSFGSDLQLQFSSRISFIQYYNIM